MSGTLRLLSVFLEQPRATVGRGMICSAARTRTPPGSFRAEFPASRSNCLDDRDRTQRRTSRGGAGLRPAARGDHHAARRRCDRFDVAVRDALHLSLQAEAWYGSYAEVGADGHRHDGRVPEPGPVGVPTDFEPGTVFVVDTGTLGVQSIGFLAPLQRTDRGRRSPRARRRGSVSAP